MEEDIDVCVGLFGTCGGSTWRNEFIEEINEMEGVTYFNPDAGDNWHPGMVDDENRHMLEDEIILFPVLAETAGTGSLTEIGFSIRNVIRNIVNGKNQSLIVLIDDVCIIEDESLAKDSMRARKLVKSKVIAETHSNIYLVDSLCKMRILTQQLIHMAILKRNVDSVFKVA